MRIGEKSSKADDEDNEMVSVYVLSLRRGKYYVGKSDRAEDRIASHFNNEGSGWTAKYPPVKVMEIIHNCDMYDEDKYTLKYMDMYGIDNVRGGSFVSIRLAEEVKRVLTQMCRGSSDKCFICGGRDHFANECDASSDESEFESEDEAEEPLCCYRCGRASHFANNCFAKFHVDGHRIT